MKKTFITIIALLTIVGLIAPAQAAAIDHGKRVTMLMNFSIALLLDTNEEFVIFPS